MTGHVLEAAWLCPGCGNRIAAGETIRPYGQAWRCAACLPAPKAKPWRGCTRTSPPPKPYNLTGLPGPAPATTPRNPYATGTTLEELLHE